MATKSLFRQTLDEVPAETHIFIRKYTDILDRIQFLLAQKGLKQRDLAQALGKSESEVSKWLSGGHNFTLRSLAKLEKVLGAEIVTVAVSENPTEDLVKKATFIGKSTRMQAKTLAEKDASTGNISHNKS